MFLKAVSTLSQINLFQVRHLKEVHRIKYKKEEFYYGEKQTVISDYTEEISDFNLKFIKCDIKTLYDTDFKEYKANLIIECSFSHFVLLVLQTNISNNIYFLILREKIPEEDILFERYYSILEYKFSNLHNLCINFIEREDIIYSYDSFLNFIETCDKLHILSYYTHTFDDYIDERNFKNVRFIYFINNYNKLQKIFYIRNSKNVSIEKLKCNT